MLQIASDSLSAADEGKWDFFRWLVETYDWFIIVTLAILIVVGLPIVGKMVQSGKWILRWGWPPLQRAKHAEPSLPEGWQAPVKEVAAEAGPAQPERTSGQFGLESSRLLWTQVGKLFDWVGQNSRHRRPIMKWSHVIEPDYSTRSTCFYVVEAADGPLLAIQLYRSSGDGRAEDFRELKLKIRGRPLGEAPRTHRWLPAGDDAHKKRFLVLFCPALQPGERYELEVENTYPDAARRLKALHSRDTYEASLEDVIDGVGSFSFSLEIRLDGRFEVELPDGSVQELPDASGRRGVTLELGHVPQQDVLCAVTRIG